MLVDTHCHLNFDSFTEDLPEVVERARQANVRWIVNPGIDLESSQAAIQLAERFDEVYAAVGVHPNDAGAWGPETLERLRELARRPKVVAIGEIGLDYYWERTTRDLQVAVLQEQLVLASELNLPVILHNRDKLGASNASTDLLEILAAWTSDMQRQNHPRSAAPGVLHSFSQDWDVAEQAMRLQFMIGITGPITYKNATVIQNVVKKAPLESVLIETDGPFLTPHPHRGTRNEPAYVRYVAEKIASLKNLPYEQVEETCTTNAKRLFHLRVNH